ncbi:hypothetical protein BsWGS_00006 [Bradybaena similaris]
MDRVNTGREKIEADKIVKRTSIRRNSQLRTLCGDVKNPKLSKLLNSPLRSSPYSSNRGFSSKRRQTRNASPRSPSRSQRYVDKGNKHSPKEGGDVRLPQCNTNLGHPDGNSAMAPPASPPRDVHRHELSTCLPQGSLPIRQTDNICQVHMLTAHSSSNNSFGRYDKQEVTLYKMRSDTQYFQNPAEKQPQFSCNTNSISSQPPGALLKGLMANYVSTKEQQVSMDMNYSQGKQNETKEPSMVGHARRMSSGICTSTTVSSNLSVRSSSSHNHTLNYDRQCVVTNTCCNKPTSAHNHIRYSGLAPKTTYSLPGDHIFTSLAGKSPPQLATFSHLGTFSGRSRLYRAPQKYRSLESYPKHGLNAHTSRRGAHACLADAPEVDSPSVLYKSRDALSQESGARSQRLGNRFSAKENHYCTYLHQDAPGQLHVNCQHYKKLVSKETQYSDTESLAGKLKTPLQHGKVVANVKERERSAEPTGHVNYPPGTSQARRCAGDKACVATTGKQQCHLQTASTKEVLLHSGDDRHKSCERCASDSSHGDFKCDSLLKEILKAVTSKIACPAFENNAKLQTGPAVQLSKASDETMLESFAETTKTDHDSGTPTCLVSKQSNKYANLNQASHRHTSKCSDGNSGKSAQPSLGSCSQNNEPSSEQSTVSLEVKSVNLCFRCSNKKAENNSCQQIKIKWATSPHTKSTWKAECIEVTGLPNCPANAVTSLTESSLKLGYGEMNGRNREHNAVVKQIETVQHVSTAEVAADERAKNNGALAHTNKTYKVISPQMVFRNRAKRLLARPSDTTLTSPSPCRSNTSTSWRAAGKPRNDKSESTFFSALETSRTTHTGGNAVLGQTPEHSLPMATTSVKKDDDKCLHRRRPGSQLPALVEGYQARQTGLAYRHRCAPKVLARNHKDNLMPAMEDRYLLLQLDWGVFIVLAATVPVLLLLLSLNFYVRASTATRPDIS